MRISTELHTVSVYDVYINSIYKIEGQHSAYSVNILIYCLGKIPRMINNLGIYSSTYQSGTVAAIPLGKKKGEKPPWKPRCRDYDI